MTKHRIILLGDSIIDNAAYVNKGEPDVCQQVMGLLPSFGVEMRAVDGSVTTDVTKQQLHDLKPDDFIILSSGGNDALGYISLLDKTQDIKSRDLMVKLWDIREEFRACYIGLLSKLKSENRKVLVLTIYNPGFAATGMDMDDQKAAESGLSIFNDVIQQEALKHRCDILELRELFIDYDDYANPIEPSAKGGAKIAERIKDWVTTI